MYILGISAYFHDSAAALIKDGVIVAAAQEERFTRKKHDESFPENAMAYCLSEGGITVTQVDYVIFYEKPFLIFERLLETITANAPYGARFMLKSMPVWMKKKLHLRKDLSARLNGFAGKLKFCMHHESHAASAFYPSPFPEAAIIVMDGVGEWASASIAVGNGNDVQMLKEIRFPHSLGLLYSAFTYYTGFTVNSGEYKMMGLAPYGEPKYVELILRELVHIKDDGSFRLNMDYFNYCTGLTMTNSRFHALFGGEPRKPDSPVMQKDMDIARSIQEVTDKIVLAIARYAAKLTGKRNLCMAGGVALNCVSNGKILASGLFDDLWIQPAAGDAGGALGAALFYWHKGQKKPRIAEKNDSQHGSCLGPSFNDGAIRAELDRVGAQYHHHKDEDGICREIAKLVDEGKIIGHFHGRMEFGPRALGSRSILGDARNPEMQSKINFAVKFRESFRPFAPIILREKAAEYFDLRHESPYMLIVAPVREEKRLNTVTRGDAVSGFERLKLKLSAVPAITHVDYSARIQTVTRERNPRLYGILKAFDTLTGTPLMVNTSFNVSDEPIVCTPYEAYLCFLRSKIDVLVLENFILYRSEQEPKEARKSWECMVTQ